MASGGDRVVKSSTRKNLIPESKGSVVERCGLTQDYTNINRIIVEEEEEIEYPAVMMCNGHPNIIYEQPFDPRKYQELQIWSKKLERARRFSDIDKGSPVKQLDDYTDEVILKEMMNKFGQLDEESENFTKIFKTFKEDRLEEVRGWIVEEESILKGLDANMVLVPEFDYLKQLLDTYHSKFSPEDIKVLNLNPCSNHFRADWLILPRLKYIGLTVKMAEKKFGVSSKLKKTIKGNVKYVSSRPELGFLPGHNAALNLAVMDPRFSYPNVIFRKQDMGIQLSITLSAFIKEFPLGVTAEFFLTKFKEKYGYTPEVEPLGFEGVLQMIACSNDIFYVTKAVLGMHPLIFPSCFAHNICDVSTLVWRVWHKIKVILSLHGVIQIDRLCDLLFETFNIKFDVRQWGYDTCEEFVREVGNKFGDDHLLIFPQTTTVENTKVNKSKLLVVDSDFNRSYIQKLREPTNPCISPSGIESEFVMLPMRIDRIKPTQGNRYLCVAANFWSPSKFFLNLKSNWNLIVNLQNDIQDYFRLWEIFRGGENESCFPPLETLVPGLPVIVAQVDGWHRAKIVRVLHDKKFKVVLYDFGDMKVVDIRRMRLMPKIFMGVLPAQGISCRLKVPELYESFHRQGERYQWGRLVVDSLYSIINNRELIVQFINHYEDLNRNVWEVSIIAIGKGRVLIDVDSALWTEDIKKKLDEQMIEVESRDVYNYCSHLEES